MTTRTTLDMHGHARLQVQIQPLMIFNEETGWRCSHCEHIFDNTTGFTQWTLFQQGRPTAAKWVVTVPATFVDGELHQTSFDNHVCDRHLPDEIQNVRDYLNGVIYELNKPVARVLPGGTSSGEGR